MKLNLKNLSVVCLSLVGLSSVSSAALADTWGPLVELRDNTEMFSNGKPSGGWWVTPIHATLLADGKVLVSGWGRRDRDNCGNFGTRKTGTSFVLDPNSLNNGGTLNIQPLHEAQQSGTADVIYCAGHTPIADGRVLFSGGARYEDLGGTNQQEFGLNYGRIYAPNTNNFTRIASPMTGGVPGTNATAWYPTNTRLPDGRVMVAGGFSRCCDGAFSNRSLQFFDPTALDQLQNPWSLLASHDSAPVEMNPGLRDYIHSFVLPTPVTVNGLVRQVAFRGANGRIILANTDAGTPSNQRFTLAPNGQRAFNAGAWDATSALVSTGEIMTMGGTEDGGAAQRMDLYNPVTGTTRSIDTGIGRRNPSSVLLPDGTVLLINGGNDWRNFGGDRRRPQIVNLETGAVTNLNIWSGDSLERGYHSFALLLKDGRVLIGGGISPIGDIGCERPDVRIYNPPYLTNGTRPVVSNAPSSITMSAGGATTQLTFSGATLKSSEQGGVVLMALGSTTHSFDQNQRYVKLSYTQSGNTLTINPPANTQIAPPGDYTMFLVSQTGAPSVGITVRINKPAQQPSSWKRTVVFIFGQTQSGQDMFVRGGLDHDQARNLLGLNCTAENKLCAMPIRHLNLRNATTAPWKANDNFLDWYGTEVGQSSAAQGSPLDWTTNIWPASWGTKRTVDVDGFGETPLNTYGQHYWMLDVEMDCSKTVNGWFELKSFISNGPGWEPNVSQAGTPYPSGNHFAQCGKKNVFSRGSNAAEITNL